jgi:hypothetical protein
VNQNEKVALEILDEIDRARSGSLTLDELEERIWRLLETADRDFPSILAGKAESLVQNIRDLQRENISFAGGREVDENHGVDAVYHEVSAALGRYVG